MAAKRNDQKMQSYWEKHIEGRFLDSKGATIGSTRDGDWTFFLKNGSPYLQGKFVAGKREGTWLSFYPNGQVRMERTYEAGRLAGDSRFFDSSGNLIAEGDLIVHSSSHDSGSWRIGDVALPTPKIANLQIEQ